MAIVNPISQILNLKFGVTTAKNHSLIDAFFSIDARLSIFKHSCMSINHWWYTLAG